MMNICFAIDISHTKSFGVPFDSSSSSYSFLSSESQAPMPKTLSALESKQTGKPGLFRATLSKPQGQRRQRPLYRGARGDGTSPVPLALRGWENGLLYTQNAFLTELAQLPHYNQIIKSL